MKGLVGAVAHMNERGKIFNIVNFGRGILL